VLYPIGACEHLISLIGLSYLRFSFESNIIVCETSILGIFASSSPDFLDVEFPSDEAILEDVIMIF
jgi:hypothetical protein